LIISLYGPIYQQPFAMVSTISFFVALAAVVPAAPMGIKAVTTVTPTLPLIRGGKSTTEKDSTVELKGV
jgi:hypothetical protein